MTKAGRPSIFVGLDVILCTYYLLLEIFTVVGKSELEGFSLPFMFPMYYPILLIVYVAMDHSKNSRFRFKTTYLATLNLITWIKSILFLKSFTKTRIFIHLLEQVILEIFAFLQIFLYSTIMFATTFFIL